MKKISFLILILILLIFIGVAHATTIDIYYPHNNTTTDIYYACNNGDNEYNLITNNSMECTNLSILIIKDQIVYDDIITNPEKLMNIKYFGLFIFLTLFIVIILLVIKVIKRGI